MPAKATLTIEERIWAVPDLHTASRLSALLKFLADDMPRTKLLTQAEIVALTKKLLNRALEQNYTTAEVEAFLRG